MKKEIQKQIHQAIQDTVILIQKQSSNKEANFQKIHIDKLIDQLGEIVKKNHLTSSDLDVIQTILMKSFQEEAANNICEELKNKVSPYLELLFFQDLSTSRQHYIAETIYNNTILIQNMSKSEIVDAIGIPFEQMNSCGRVLATIVYMLTMNNLSDDLIEKKIEKMFGFSKELCQYLVSLVSKDKTELRMIMLLRYLSDIEDRLEPIEDLFRSILKEDEEDDDIVEE